MKNLMIVLGLLALSHSAMALPFGKFQSKITYMNLDHNLFAGQTIDTGSIILNKDNNTVAIILDQEVIELPITSVETSVCGSVTYHAVKDLRPFDGSLQKIDVTDNAAFHCESVVQISPVTANYSTDGYNPRAGEVKSESNFAGTAFELSYNAL